MTIHLKPHEYKGYQMSSGGQKHSGNARRVSTLTEITRALSRAYAAKFGKQHTKTEKANGKG